MVVTQDFGSCSRGPSPLIATINTLLVQWIVHESSKVLVKVRVLNGVHKCWVRIGGQFIRLSIWREEFKSLTQY